MAWLLEGGACFLLSSDAIFPASVSSSEHGREITEIQVSALLEISLARVTWNIQRDPETTPIETFHPELKRPTQFTRFRKLLKVTRPTRPCLEVINEAANNGGEEGHPSERPGSCAGSSRGAAFVTCHSCRGELFDDAYVCLPPMLQLVSLINSLARPARIGWSHLLCLLWVLYLKN